MFIEHTFSHAALELNYAAGPPGGSPLILLHGVTRRWQTYLPLLPSLVPRWQPWLLDFRGHGRSARAAGKYLVTDYVADAIAFVQRFDQPAVVYGHSLGAMVAAAVAAELPAQVRAVVLEDPPLHTMGRRITESVLLSFFRGLQPFAGSRGSVREIAHELADLRLRNPQNDVETRLGDVRDAVSLRFTASGLRQLDPAVLLPIIERRWLDGYEVESVFRRIVCPVLLIQADEAAGGMLIDDDAAQVEALSADVTRIKLPGVGHLVHWTVTPQLANLVSGFLESC